MKTVQECKKQGKENRKAVPRSSMGEWKVETRRKVVEDLIREQESTRQQHLLPLRHERMAASPFAFFRGAAIIQAHDLATLPTTELRVQAVGDAHISNFGIFASPERRLVFDINDFDETSIAPFECDIKRLMTSIEICGRNRGFAPEQRQAAIEQAARVYRNSMMKFSEMGNMDVWYQHLDLENFIAKDPHFTDPLQKTNIDETIKKALSKNSEKAIKKYTEIYDGKLRIKSDPPIIVPLRDLIGEDKVYYSFQHNIADAIKLYQKSLPNERRSLIDQYEPLEMAHKVVGVGSVGTKAWILIMMGQVEGDPLVLQIKEASASVLERYFGASTYKEHGRRVVEGQRSIQTAGDILLGWVKLVSPDGRIGDYYVRQLWDDKGTFDLDKIGVDGLTSLASICAWTLAHAHAKTGDRHAIAGYLGKGDKFEKAMMNYSKAYADQNEADYETFIMKFRR